jgi:hypothetical protein
MLQLMMGHPRLNPHSQDSGLPGLNKAENQTLRQPRHGYADHDNLYTSSSVCSQDSQKVFWAKANEFHISYKTFWGKKKTMAWKQVSNQGKRKWNIFHSQMYTLTAMIVLKLSSARTISEALCCTNTQHSPLSVRVRSQRRSELDHEEVKALMPKKIWQKERWHF